MKSLIFIFTVALLLPLSSYAQGDECCVMSSESGNKVTTTASYMTPGKCKPGKEENGKKICAVYKGKEDTFCSTRSDENKKIRCTNCGYTWVDGLCYVKDPVELAKEELKEKEEEKAKEEAKKKEEKAEETR